MTDEGVNSVENRCKGPTILSQSSISQQPFIGRHRGKTSDFLPVTAAPDPAFRWGCVATGGREGELPVGWGGNVRANRVKRREGQVNTEYQGHSYGMNYTIRNPRK
jgi:hypothetical protein